MRCDPPADVNTNRRDLRTVDPNPFKTGLRKALRHNAERCQRIYQALFNASEVSANIAFPFSQIKDGITDQLPRAVVGHIPAPVGLIELDSSALQDVLAGEDVFRFSVTAHRYNVGMFD